MARVLSASVAPVAKLVALRTDRVDSEELTGLPVSGGLIKKGVWAEFVSR